MQEPKVEEKKQENFVYEVTDGTGKVVGHLKIKKTIEEYANGAIACLTAQLGTTSKTKKARLNARIAQWNRVLEDLLKRKEPEVIPEVAVVEQPIDEPK